MNIEYVQHMECDGCEYRETEIVEETLYVNGTPHIVNTSLRCKNYFICQRIIEKCKADFLEKEIHISPYQIENRLPGRPAGEVQKNWK